MGKNTDLQQSYLGLTRGPATLCHLHHSFLSCEVGAYTTALASWRSKQSLAHIITHSSLEEAAHLGHVRLGAAS